LVDAWQFVPRCCYNLYCFIIGETVNKILALVLGLVVIGCSVEEPEPQHVLLLGNSITVGWDYKELGETAWYNEFPYKIKYTDAIIGSTTKGLSDRLELEAYPEFLDLFIINIGVNDITQDVGDQSEYIGIILDDLALKYPLTKVLLVSPHTKEGQDYNQYNHDEMARLAAGRYFVDFLDLKAEFEDEARWEGKKIDLVHLNKAGYVEYAGLLSETVYRLLGD